MVAKNAICPGTLVLAILAAAAGCGGPDAPPAKDAPPATTTATRIEPMPDSGFSVEWGVPGVPSVIAPRQVFAAGVRVTNKGNQTWFDVGSTRPPTFGGGAVRLGARWARSGGPKAGPRGDGYGAARGELLAPVRPGQSAVLAIAVVSPEEPGEYLLQLDLCQELVSWFEDKGASTLIVPVRVK